MVRAHLPGPLTQTKQCPASSKMGKDSDEALCESSWTALAKGRERGWWSIDLEVKWRSWK